MALRLDKQFVDEIIAHAKADAPNECCGIVAGKDGRSIKLWRTKNSEQSPYRFNVDARDLFRITRECDENGWDMLVIYHSHLMSEAYPSPTDVRFAEGWPDQYYVLVSLMDPDNPVVRAYRILDAVITEEPIETT